MLSAEHSSCSITPDPMMRKPSRRPARRQIMQIKIPLNTPPPCVTDGIRMHRVRQCSKSGYQPVIGKVAEHGTGDRSGGLVTQFHHHLKVITDWGTEIAAQGGRYPRLGLKAYVLTSNVARQVCDIRYADAIIGQQTAKQSLIKLLFAKTHV